VTNAETLSDDYERSGTNLDDLCTALTEMDAMTTIEYVNTLDVELLSLIAGQAQTSGRIPFRVFHPYDGEKPSVAIAMKAPARKALLAPLVKELAENRLMLRVGNQLYYTSSILMSTMSCRAGLGGANIYLPSTIRDSYIAELFGRDDKDIRMVVRSAGKIRKVFAMHSDKYTQVPQITLFNIISEIKHGLGKPVCRGWSINHNRSVVYLDFPEKAKDFSKIYGTPPNIIPGLRLVTSDVGDSSVCAVGTWRIGSVVLGSDIYTRQHRGKVAPAKILEGINHTIFARYERIPKALSGLLLISLSDPIAVIESVLRQIKMADKVGKRCAKSIEQLLCGQIQPDLSYTAYDVAKSIMTLPATLKGLSANGKKELKVTALNAVFADYTDPELFLTAA